MAENAQTMTEFTYAPGETDVIGDRFRPSVVASWLKTSIAVSNTRVQYKAPNTLLGLIQLGETTKAIPADSCSCSPASERSTPTSSPP